MMKLKKKVHRKIEDFYAEEDLQDPDREQKINLTIHDFDKNGELPNPPAPCVVTTIDPHYIKNSKKRILVKKFRVKTDIIRYREITRKQFVMYTIEETFLLKKREMEHQENVYKRLMEFYKMAGASLDGMKSDAFNDMLKPQKEYERLKSVKIDDELRETMGEYQRIIMDVEEIYRRFLYLVKMISYLDDIAIEELEECERDEDEEAVDCEKPLDVLNLQEGKIHIQQVKRYMEKVVRPYLEKRKHLDANIWIRGFENIRHKISNYNKRFTKLALLNHVVGIVHAKAEKTFAKIIERPLYLKDPNFMSQRADTLKTRALEIMDAFEQKQRDDKLNLKISALVPVILKQIEHCRGKNKRGLCNGKREIEKQHSKKKEKGQKETVPFSYLNDEEESTLSQVEKIQAYVLELLATFDNVPAGQLRMIELRTRRRYNKQKLASRKALVKQSRMQNWLEHFKKHEINK